MSWGLRIILWSPTDPGSLLLLSFLTLVLSLSGIDSLSSVFVRFRNIVIHYSLCCSLFVSEDTASSEECNLSLPQPVRYRRRGMRRKVVSDRFRFLVFL